MSRLIAKKLLQGKITTPSKICVRSYHPIAKDYIKPITIEPLTYTTDSLQSKVLGHCLANNVPKHGFKEKAIVQSINQLGLSPSLISVLGSSNSPSFFHSSPAVLELIKYHLVTKRHELTKDIPQDNIDHNNGLPSLEELMIKRLQMDIPVGGQLTDLFAQLSIPSQYLMDTALPELFNLADDMIYFSNEKDHFDMAWYTKRLGVSFTYVTSKLFMAQDKSPNFSETMQFAHDKLYNVMKLGDYYNNAEEFAWYTLMVSTNLIKSQLARK
ncbi:similar to Saccharomyces cerevisiae YLR201C COQ9 Protein required for ubiquinone (coenzyme Q) biosynthesis and respiratory growth [Maudiozyma saulgeensis]|uniref:Ubiquinone biosynthesis protein n=1 Tax=Maudiozyma saulgeensis TaxID=1789683 RepID=A0A1X7R2H5_9SACH|nr:similar to Saccharomyces cerevisiae YLR201C COQ9 Protein required for ubiquinone (coenzyme Q) biosynthesis and respiratory growth [Kazachstania saulgeensis]